MLILLWDHLYQMGLYGLCSSKALNDVHLKSVFFSSSFFNLSVDMFLYVLIFLFIIRIIGRVVQISPSLLCQWITGILLFIKVSPVG